MSKMLNGEGTVKLHEDVLDLINGGTEELKKRDADEDGKKLGDVRSSKIDRRSRAY